MPHSEQHHRQKKKNWVLLGVLIALIALIYAISLMRMGFKMG